MYQSKLAEGAHCSISTSFRRHLILTDDTLQFDTSCPETNTLDSNGDCSTGNYATGPAYNLTTGRPTSCVLYCEAKVQWFYGQEVPYSGTECAANESCTFSNAETVSVTNTWTFEGGINLGSSGDDDPLEAAFNLGASYSYAITKSTTQTLTQPRPPLTLASCGYWTFLPFYIQYVIFPALKAPRMYLTH